MNKHIFFDKLTTAIAALTLGKNKFFSKSIKSLRYKEYLEEIKLSLSSLEEGIHEVEAETSIGKMDPAYLIAQWKGKEYPTLIYHHGNNERPFDFRRFAKNSFKNIFIETKEAIEANIIAVRAPFHNGSLKIYQKKIGHLSNFVAMLSTSTKLVEDLIQLLKKETNTSVFISGISLGGWVTNLHRTYFNTADGYIPLLAGAALDHLFTDSSYKKMGGKIAQENPDLIKKVLNFEEDFKKVQDDNIFPLLARYDQYIQYERQKLSYEDRNIEIIENGHVTSLLATEKLRNHILSVIKKYKNE